MNEMPTESGLLQHQAARNLSRNCSRSALSVFLFSTRQYGGLVDEWVTAIDLRAEEYGTHSRRRTKASIIDGTTGNIRAIQILLGRSEIENTVRYLGVDVADALLLAERTEIRRGAVIRAVRMAAPDIRSDRPLRPSLGGTDRTLSI